MAYRADEVKVGLVIIVSLLILGGFIVAILGLKIGQPTQTYTTSLRFAGGINPGTAVRYGGMQVGKVREVSVAPMDSSRIQFTVDIQAETPIKTDSEVFINTIGFLGEYYLEISTGSSDAPLLPPGAEIPAREIATLNDILARTQSAVERVDAALVIINEKILTEDLVELRERIDIIGNSMEKLLTDVDQFFAEENRENIRQTLAHLRSLVQENREDIRRSVESFRSASERLDSLAASLDKLVVENRDNVDALIDDIRAAAVQARGAADRVEKLIAENAGDIAITIDNLRATSSNARDFSETIADEPWRLLYRTRQPEKQVISPQETGAGAH